MAALQVGAPLKTVLFLISRVSHAQYVSNEMIAEFLLISSTVQKHRIPSSSNVSALKVTLCGSAIVISVSVGSALAIKTGFRSTMPNNLFNVFAFRCYDTKWCPVSFGNSSASLRMCQLKLEFLMNYTLCPC